MAVNSDWLNKKTRVLFICIITAIIMILAALRTEIGFIPTAERKSIAIRVEYSGAFEREMEELVTNPLEREIAKLPGIKEIFSVSEQGKSRIHVTLSQSTDMRRTYLKLRDLVDYAYSTFPDGVKRPVITKSDAESRPVFIAAFGKDTGLKEDELKRRFENVDGAGEIEVGGAYKSEIRISFYPEKLESRSIGIEKLVSSLRNNNIIGGFGRGASGKAILDSRLVSVNDIRRLVISGNTALEDLARVELCEAEKEILGRVDGKEKIVVYVSKSSDTNTVRLCKALSSLTAELPGGRVLYSYGEKIESGVLEVALLALTGICGAILLSAIIRRRLAFAGSLFLTVCFADLSAVALSGLFSSELHLFLIGGILGGNMIALFMSFIFRTELNRNAYKSTANAILFSAFVCCALFLPLIFGAERLKEIAGPIALAVCVSILASVAFLFMVIRPFAAATSNANAKTENKGNEPAKRIIASILAFADRRRAVCLFCVIAISAGTLLLSMLVSREELTYDSGTSLELTLEYDSGTTLDHVFEDASALEDYIVEEYITKRKSVKSEAARYEKERARFDITLREGADRKAFVEDLEAREKEFPEAFFFFPETRKGGASFEVILTGPDPHELKALAWSLSESIKSLSKAKSIVFHYKEVLPSHLITIDTDKSAVTGVDPYSAYNTCYWSLLGPVAAKWNPGEEEADMRIILANSRDLSLDDLLRLKVYNSNNEPVALESIASLKEHPENGRIYHFNRQRSLSFSVFTEQDARNRAKGIAEKAIASFPFRPGYRAEIDAGEDGEETVAASIFFAIALSAALVLLLLVIRYESIKLPLAIIAQVPISFFAPLLLLFALNLPLSIPVYTGLVLTAAFTIMYNLMIFPSGRNAAGADFSAAKDSEGKIASIAPGMIIAAASVIPLLFARLESAPFFRSFALVLVSGCVSSYAGLLIWIPLVKAHRNLKGQTSD